MQEFRLAMERLQRMHKIKRNEVSKALKARVRDEFTKDSIYCRFHEQAWEAVTSLFHVRECRRLPSVVRFSSRNGLPDTSDAATNAIGNQKKNQTGFG